MSSSLYIPVTRVPTTTAALTSALSLAFEELGISSPAFRHEGAGENIFNYFIYLTSGDNWCVITYYTAEPEVTDDKDRPFMVAIKTRGDWSFAAATAVAVCIVGGGVVIYDDAHELGNEDTISFTALKHRVIAK